MPLKTPNGKHGIPPRASSCCNHDPDCAIHAEPHNGEMAECTCPELAPLFRHPYRAPRPHKANSTKSCT